MVRKRRGGRGGLNCASLQGILEDFSVQELCLALLPLPHLHAIRQGKLCKQHETQAAVSCECADANSLSNANNSDKCVLAFYCNVRAMC